MGASLNPAMAIRLTQAAVDNGFDVALPAQGGWLAFESTQTPLKLWLTHFAEGTLFLAAFSAGRISAALEANGTPLVSPLPDGAVAGRSVADVPSLYRLVRRVFQLSRSLPDAPLQLFQERAASLPRTTEAERWVVQRVGQELFRAALLDFWDGRCAVTGLSVPRLLRASHIKPWADCQTDAERLDVHNGLLLAPQLDAAFDGGFITFADDGACIVSSVLEPSQRELIGLEGALRIVGLTEHHRRYLAWHRERIFE